MFYSYIIAGSLTEKTRNCKYYILYCVTANKNENLIYGSYVNKTVIFSYVDYEDSDGSDYDTRKVKDKQKLHKSRKNRKDREKHGGTFVEPSTMCIHGFVRVFCRTHCPSLYK